MQLRTIGIVAHESFPTDSYNSVSKKVVELYSGKPVSGYDEFSWAWNGIGHRYHGAIRLYDLVFLSFADHFQLNTHEKRHAQEEDIFHCVCSAFSTIEYLYFATAALLTLRVGLFDFDTESGKRGINPIRVAREVERKFPASSLATSLLDPLSPSDGEDSEFIRFSSVRNTLIHRHHPGRNFYSSAYPGLPTVWQDINLPLNTELFEKRRRFLTNTTNRIVGELNSFLDLAL